ncbi:MAG: glycosyltransferase family 2 protein [Vicinamibacterales bacterium]|nr:glycosyltransferase family 2 protein [Vicinamibacterales bacterium]
MSPSRPALRVLAASIAHNEASKIGRVIERFPPGLVDRIVVVDDASTDETPKVAAEKGAVILTHAQRSGAGAAIRTAIKYAMAEGFDVLVVLAGNDKDRPPEIERLLAPIAGDGYDFVQGSRYLKGGDFGNMPFYRQLATRYMHPLLFSLFVGRRFTDTTNGFRAIRLSALRELQGDGSARHEDLPAARARLHQDEAHHGVVEHPAARVPARTRHQEVTRGHRTVR